VNEFWFKKKEVKRSWSYVKIKKQNGMNAAPGSNYQLNQNNYQIVCTKISIMFLICKSFLNFFLVRLDYAKLIHPVNPDRNKITVYDIIEFGWSAIHVSQEGFDQFVWCAANIHDVFFLGLL